MRSLSIMNFFPNDVRRNISYPDFLKARRQMTITRSVCDMGKFCCLVGKAEEGRDDNTSRQLHNHTVQEVTHYRLCLHTLTILAFLPLASIVFAYLPSHFTIRKCFLSDEFSSSEAAEL